MFLMVDDMKENTTPNLKNLQPVSSLLLSSLKLLEKGARRKKQSLQDRSLAAASARAALAVAGQMESSETCWLAHSAC